MRSLRIRLVHSSASFLALAVLWPAAASAQDAIRDWDTLAACRKLDLENKISQALPALQKLSKCKDRDLRIESLFLLGKACNASGRLKDAQQSWEKVVTEWNPSAFQRKADRALGDLFRAAGNLDRAVAAYSEVISSENLADPEKVVAAEALGDIYGGRNDAKRAVEMYQFALKVADGLYESDLRGLNLAGIRQKLNPVQRTTAVESSGEAKVLFEEAERLRKAGNYDGALAKYRDIVSRFPQSPEVAPSGLHVGTCLVALLRFDEAEKQWNEFIKAAPEGPYRGHALVGLADLLLEFRLDPKAATDRLAAYFKGAEAGYTTWMDVRGDAEFCRAAVAYINGDRKRTIDALQAAKEYRPAPDEYREKGAPTTLDRLITALQDGKEITPPYIRQGGSGQARTAIVLGDLYAASGELTKAQALYERLNPSPLLIQAKDLSPREATDSAGTVVEPSAVLAKVRSMMTARSHDRKCPLGAATLLQLAWSRLQEGKSRYKQFDFPGALGCLAEFLTIYDKTPMAPEAFLYAGIASNLMRPAGPKLAEAIFDLTATKYPESKEARTAAYFGAVKAYNAGRTDEAVSRFQKVLERYPSPAMNEAVKGWLEQIRQEAKQVHEQKGGSK